MCGLMDVLLVDDHPILHLTVGAVVRAVSPEAAFHAEADLAAGVARALALDDLALVLLDLGLPGCTGIQALERFRDAVPSARIAVISGTEDAGTVRAALDAGASGYLPKTSTAKVMISAVQVMLGGGTYIPPQATAAAKPTDRKLADAGLTERQGEVLSLLVEGLTNAQIARRLRLSENTVKQHVHAAYRALGVSSRIQAAVALARIGIKVS